MVIRFGMPSLQRIVNKKIKVCLLAHRAFCLIFAALSRNGPVAQLNRASDYGSEGFRFES